MKPIVVNRPLHQLICTCRQRATRAVLPSGVESSGPGPCLTALVGTLGCTIRLSHLKIQRFPGEGFGVRISTGATSCIRRRGNSLLEQPVAAAYLPARAALPAGG